MTSFQDNSSASKAPRGKRGPNARSDESNRIRSRVWLRWSELIAAGKQIDLVQTLWDMRDPKTRGLRENWRLFRHIESLGQSPSRGEHGARKGFDVVTALGTIPGFESSVALYDHPLWRFLLQVPPDIDLAVTHLYSALRLSTNFNRMEELVFRKPPELFAWTIREYWEYFKGLPPPPSKSAEGFPPLDNLFLLICVKKFLTLIGSEGNFFLRDINIEGGIAQLYEWDWLDDETLQHLDALITLRVTNDSTRLASGDTSRLDFGAHIPVVCRVISEYSGFDMRSSAGATRRAAMNRLPAGRPRPLANNL